MTRIEVYLLAFALAMDAFSVGAGVGVRCTALRQLFRLSFHFGLFQSLFAAIGALAGVLLLPLIESWDHWVVFAILVFLGARMIRQAVKGDVEDLQQLDLTRGHSLVALSSAVSFDAMGAGVSLPGAQVSMVESVLVIGLVSLMMTVLAMVIGKRVGTRFGKVAEIGAGVVLILIGSNILFTHLATTP